MDVANAILRATDFAAHKHRRQMRKDGSSPYINHPIRVATILSDEAGVNDVAVLQAALLHDTVEDTECTFQELQDHFGELVAYVVLALVAHVSREPAFLVVSKVCSSLVRECSDDKSLPYAERKRLQIEHAAHATPQAKLVKLADKISNLRDLQRTPPLGWDRTRILEYFAWARQVTDGCRGVNEKLDAILDELYSQGPFHFERNA